MHVKAKVLEDIPDGSRSLIELRVLDAGNRCTAGASGQSYPQHGARGRGEGTARGLLHVDEEKTQREAYCTWVLLRVAWNSVSIWHICPTYIFFERPSEPKTKLWGNPCFRNVINFI
jgi:hypothetical protein